MVTALSLHECWQGALFYVFLLAVVAVRLLVVGVFVVVGILGIHISPAWFKYFLAAHFEFHLLFFTVSLADYFAQDGCGRELAVRIKDTDEALGNEVVHIGFHICKSRGWHSCRDDGMVVGHFAVVEHLFALGQFLSCCCQLLYQGQVFLLAVDLCLTHTIENLRTFGVDVVGKKLGVHTRIGSKFLLV